MITSKTNSNIVMLKKLLADKKYRTATNSYCIEGFRLLADAIKYNKPISSIYVSADKVDRLPPHLPCEYTVVDSQIMHGLSSTVNGQGVIAVLDIVDNCSSLSDRVLVCEQLQDPGNMGTLLRSAVAFGYNSVVAIDCVDVYSPKVIRSAMSAHFTASIHVVDSLGQALALLEGHKLYVADMGGTDVASMCVTGKMALLLGNEGNGVSEQAQSTSHTVVSLPMDNGLESLNVAVAGSILMYSLK